LPKKTQIKPVSRPLRPTTEHKPAAPTRADIANR
jgi:hypothetical protein